MHYVYLDYNATSPVDKRVVDAMLDVWQFPANPSSIHKFGKQAKMLMEEARRQVLGAMNLPETHQVIFTSSGTESNNIALTGLRDVRVITSTIEHHSVLNVVGEGLIPVDKNGVVDLIALEDILASSSERKLISIMLANNETGVIQPLQKIITIAKRYNCLVHTDAIQALGKMKIDWSTEAPDMISISAHKFGGPQGIAALIFNKSLDITPIMKGGGQEFRLRPGTQNLAGIVGMAKACSLIGERIEKYSKVEQLRNNLEKTITDTCKNAIVFSSEAKRLPNTSSISMPKVSAETQVIHFDLAGIALSAGSACSSGRVDIPHVQASMGYGIDEANCAIRVSFGPEATLEEANKFIDAWTDLYKKTYGGI